MSGDSFLFGKSGDDAAASGIVQAADYANELYQKRPPMRNGDRPPISSLPGARQPQDQQIVTRPPGLYGMPDTPIMPGRNGVPYNGGQPDAPAAPPTAVGDGRPRVPDRPSTAITVEVADKNKPVGFGFSNLLEWGAQGAGAYYQYKYRLPDLMKDQKVDMTDTQAGKLEQRGGSYVQYGDKYLDMLQERYKHTVDEIEGIARDRNITDMDAFLKDDKAVKEFRSSLTGEQQAHFDNYRQFHQEFSRVRNSLNGIPAEVRNIDLAWRPIRPEIPVSNVIGADSTHNPWGIRERSSDFTTVLNMNKHGDAFSNELEAAAKERAGAQSAFQRGIFLKMGLGYGADFLYDRSYYTNAEPSYMTYACDFGASFLATLPATKMWHYGAQVGGMVLAHAFGRGLDAQRQGKY